MLRDARPAGTRDVDLFKLEQGALSCRPLIACPILLDYDNQRVINSSKDSSTAEPVPPDVQNGAIKLLTRSRLSVLTPAGIQRAARVESLGHSPPRHALSGLSLPGK